MYNKKVYYLINKTFKKNIFIYIILNKIYNKKLQKVYLKM
jgi:hypothetical protein